MKGEEPAVVPVVTNDPQGQAALPGLEAYEFFMGAKAKRATTWENKVTIRRSSFHPLFPLPSVKPPSSPFPPPQPSQIPPPLLSSIRWD